MSLILLFAVQDECKTGTGSGQGGKTADLIIHQGLQPFSGSLWIKDQLSSPADEPCLLNGYPVPFQITILLTTLRTGTA